MMAICDILGFSSLVMNFPLDDVIENAIVWFRKALTFSLHGGDFPDKLPDLPEIEIHDKLGLVTFSDTVFIYTLEDTIDCYRNLCATVASLLFVTMPVSHTRVRCGISYGEAFIDKKNGIYVGKPIIEGHELESVQQWSGGAFTKEAVAQLPEGAQIGHFYDWFTIPYKVPLKKGTSNLAVDWTKGFHLPLTIPWSQNSSEPTDQDKKESPDVCEKWKNTVEFHKRVCKQCNYHNH